MGGTKQESTDFESTLEAFGVLVVVSGFLLLAIGAVWLLFAGSSSVAPKITLLSFGFVGIAGGIIMSTIATNRIEARKRQAVKAELGGDSADYFQRLVNINVENLSAYYFTVKSHANKSFYASLFVGIVGFALIGTGIGLTLHGGNNGPSVALLSGISGVATEFISAVFFYLYNRTVIQMKEYHDSLLAVQNILLSFKLVDGTSNASEKTKMIGQMLQYLVRPKVNAAVSGSKESGASRKRRKTEPDPSEGE